MGDRQMVVATLALADDNEGFDLNLDGKIDGLDYGIIDGNINTQGAAF